MASRSRQANDPPGAVAVQPQDLSDLEAQHVDGSDVALPTEVVTGELSTLGPAMTTLVQWLDSRAVDGDQATAQAMEDAVARILSKEADAVKILTEDVPISGKTFTNRPFRLNSFVINEGDFEGSPYYASLNVSIGNPPEGRILNVGGLKVLAKLMMLEEAGEWPVVAMLKGNQTRAGYTVLDLVMPE